MSNHDSSNYIKIIAVTVTRIESDIIESFVRHTLTFADELIVYDNDSHDGTSDILHQLQMEGLPLYVERHYKNVEFNHGEIMTKLCHIAVEHGATVILPFDVDEFLVNTENNIPIRDVLCSMVNNQVVIIPLIQYFLNTEYTGDTFILDNVLQRECTNSNDYKLTPKCIIPSRCVNNDFSLTQGCHFVETKNGPLSVKRLPYLHLAHFHYRSEERYQIKSALGWLGTICKYGINTSVCAYMKTNYRQMLENDNCKTSTWNMQSNNDSKEDIDLHSNVICHDIKYHSYIKLRSMHIIMWEAQKLAEAYTEEKTVRYAKSIDLLILYDGRSIGLIRLLDKIKQQTYPLIEIYVLCNVQLVSQLDEIKEYIHVISFNSKQELMGKLARLKGDYVQLLTLDDDIMEKHFEQMLSVVLFNGYNFRICIPNSSTQLDLSDKNEYIIMQCNQLWKRILINGNKSVPLLKNVLISRSLLPVIQNTIYKSLIASGDGDYIAIWRDLLLAEYGDFPSEQQVYIYKNLDDDDTGNGLDLSKNIQGLFAWFKWLNHDNGMLDDNELNIALQHFITEGDKLERLSEVEENIKVNYKRLKYTILGK